VFLVRSCTARCELLLKLKRGQRLEGRNNYLAAVTSINLEWGLLSGGSLKKVSSPFFWPTRWTSERTTAEVAPKQCSVRVIIARSLQLNRVSSQVNTLLCLVRTMPAFEVPIIDIGDISSATLERRMEVALEIGTACKDVGFFVIVNHGVEQEVLDNMWRETAAFFDRPVGERESSNHATCHASVMHDDCTCVCCTCTSLTRTAPTRVSHLAPPLSVLTLPLSSPPSLPLPLFPSLSSPPSLPLPLFLPTRCPPKTHTQRRS